MRSVHLFLFILEKSTRFLPILHASVYKNAYVTSEVPAPMRTTTPTTITIIITVLLDDFFEHEKLSSDN